MNTTFRYVSTALLGLTIVANQSAQAQTLNKNTAWLQKQLNALAKEDEDHNVKVNGKKSTPKFDFKGCQMNMNIDSKDEDVSVGMNLAWQLKDVRKVSYKREKDGNYALVLDVPADKVKMNMGIGGFSGTFNMNDEKDKKDKGENSTSSFSLTTKDEKVVKELKQKFDESVELCRKGKTK